MGGRICVNWSKGGVQESKTLWKCVNDDYLIKANAFGQYLMELGRLNWGDKAVRLPCSGGDDHADLTKTGKMQPQKLLQR